MQLQTYIFLRPPNVLECMNVILLHSNQRHVSAIHVTIFRVVIKSPNFVLNSRLQVYNIDKYKIPEHKKVQYMKYKNNLS